MASISFASESLMDPRIQVKLDKYQKCGNIDKKLGKRDKMRGLTSILSLFRNEFNKFNNTRARMLDSIYHMTLRLL